MARACSASLEDGGAANGERVLIGPDTTDDLQGGIVTVGMDGDETATRRQCPRQRRHNGSDLVFGRTASPIRLRGDHEVELAVDGTLPRNRIPQDELPVPPIEDMHGRVGGNRVPGRGGRADVPVGLDGRMGRPDLEFEVVGCLTLQLVNPPPHITAARQARRFGVSQVGDHEHEFGVFSEPIGQPAKSVTHVFDTDLLADDPPRDVGEATMQTAHQKSEHRRVAHAGVEDAKRPITRLEMVDVPGDALGDLHLLVGGRHEHRERGSAVEEPLAPVGHWVKATVGLRHAQGRPRVPGSLRP